MRVALPFAYASVALTLIACGSGSSSTESVAAGSGATSGAGGQGGQIGQGGQGQGGKGQGGQGQGGEAGQGGQGGSSSGALPLGKVTDLGTVDCASVPNANSLPQGNATCRTLAVDCPGTDTIQPTVAVIEPASAAIGTIVVHGGGGGDAFFAQKQIAAKYLMAGYRIVEVEWPSDWESFAGGTASIKTAACRPATVIRWAFDVPHGGKTSAAFCGQGHSGGSAVLSYALAWYGLDEIFDYVMLTQGPPFGEMDCGCDPKAAGCSPPALCPEIPAPATQLPQKVADWAGVSSCGMGGLTDAELAKLKADSVASDGGDFDYPKTAMSAWYCAQMPNGTTGGGAFYLARVNNAAGAKPSVFCSPNCQVENIYNQSAELSDKTLVSDDMLQQMTTECVPRHM